MQTRVKVGHLVVVPFGKQTVQGVVLRFVDQPSVAETRPVLDVVDPSAVLTPQQLDLARFIAQSCLAPLAECIGLMLPPGLAQQADVVYALQQTSELEADHVSSSKDLEALSETQTRLLALIQKRGPLRSSQIDPAFRHVDWRLAARALVKRKLLTSYSVLPPPRVQPKFVRTAQLACPPQAAERALPSLAPALLTVEGVPPLEDALARLEKFGKSGTAVQARRQALLRYLDAANGPLAASSVYTATGSNRVDLEKLADLGLVKLGEGSSPMLERRQVMLQFLLREPGPVNVTWLYAESGGNLADLSALAEQGLVILGETETWRDPLEGMEYPVGEPPTLTQDQLRVWDVVQKRVQEAAAGRPVPTLLLHGVTGSGKTEIYLRAVEETLALGRQAIILVPEIALTPQTVRRFMARFPGQVGLVHSALSSGERYDTWRRARAGQLGVVVGPRSALFAPLPNLGLIVVDECHDDSYYQADLAPYFHARDVAIAYARRSGALCLLGSATPDIPSAYQAGYNSQPGSAVSNAFQYLSLPARILAHRQVVQVQLERLALEGHSEITGSQGQMGRYKPLEGQAEMIDLPPVQVVDMRQELQAGNRSIFSHALQTALEQVLDRKEQAILFLNRRGTATYVFCRNCGHSLKCPHCDLPLTYHGPQQVLTCHACGYRRQMPEKCPVCASRHIRHYGTGTERVEAEVQALFPNATTLRWDYDTTRKKGAHEIILSHFAHHRADILIGTQMLAKGLDMPLVTLVGVILADVGLNLPDYRAAERTFQVLTQVAGRAGRSPLGGQVILQTFQPENYVIRAAASHDYKGFYEQELRFRRRLGYPPFVHLVRLEYRHPDAEQAERTAKALATQVRNWMASGERRATQIVGPAPCFFARLGEQYRWQIILRGPDPASLLQSASGSLHASLANWRIEVNPPSLL